MCCNMRGGGYCMTRHAQRRERASAHHLLAERGVCVAGRTLSDMFAGSKTALLAERGVCVVERMLLTCLLV